LKKIIFIILYVFFSCFGLIAEDVGTLTIRATPFVSIPVADGGEYFAFGGGVRAVVDYAPPFLPFIDIGVDSRYTIHPFVTADIFHLFLFAGRARFNLAFSQRFGAFLSGGAGYYYGFPADQPQVGGGNFAVFGDAGISLGLTDNISIGVEGSYSLHRSFFDSVSISLSASFGLDLRTERDGPPLIIANSESETIFPVLYQQYESDPFGTITIRNNRDEAIHNISVIYFIDTYMHAPRTCVAALSLESDETFDVPINALFNDAVLAVTERSKVSSRIILRYVYKGRERTEEYYDTVLIENRNAQIWDDAAKVASFVSAQDPEVMSFSKLSAVVARQSPYTYVDLAMRKAVAIHEAVRLHGLAYVIDPISPYQELSLDSFSVDYLQFPRQTLLYKAGDCDDLSILYNALLESAGVETAFITIPGHIYIAFALEMVTREAQLLFGYADDLIFKNEKVWIPLEVTALDGDFLQAWFTGAQEWRTAVQSGDAGFIPTREAWRIYEPVWYRPVRRDEKFGVEPPDLDEVSRRLNLTTEKHIRREISVKVQEIEERMEGNTNTEKYTNRIGLVYARYGLLEAAAEQFSDAIAQNADYLPATVNLANILFLQASFEEALSQYEKAYQAAPENRKIVLNLAQSYYELERFEEAAQIYTELKKIDGVLAEENAHLESSYLFATRAASVGENQREIEWLEEE
jgi:tetratricopeptide (TPR) repeat protein